MIGYVVIVHSAGDFFHADAKQHRLSLRDAIESPPAFISKYIYFGIPELTQIQEEELLALEHQAQVNEWLKPFYHNMLSI